jgi:hypothetical protein
MRRPARGSGLNQIHGNSWKIGRWAQWIGVTASTKDKENSEKARLCGKLIA